MEPSLGYQTNEEIKSFEHKHFETKYQG